MSEMIKINIDGRDIEVEKGIITYMKPKETWKAKESWERRKCEVSHFLISSYST